MENPGTVIVPIPIKPVSRNCLVSLMFTSEGNTIENFMISISFLEILWLGYMYFFAVDGASVGQGNGTVSTVIACHRVYVRISGYFGRILSLYTC